MEGDNMLMLYFSGTGNSKYIAEKFSEKTKSICYSIEEISEILKVSEGTTKSRIHNTIKKLRELLS